MAIQLIPVSPSHHATLGDICFRAFSTLQDRHAVERDFDSAHTATMMISMFASRPDIAGFAAQDTKSGAILGSNFLWFSDAVAGVGPITIEPSAQSAGIGRLLMQAVMDEASRRNITQVRLCQEAINTTSLSLYTKLGFDWREACNLMRAAPAPADDPRIRPMTEQDLPAVDRISAHHYHASRVNESAGLLRAQFPAFCLVEKGEIAGYHFPGFIGHGFAQTDEQLASLVTHACRHVPPPFHKCIVPLGEHGLHRALLAKGCKSIKLLNYMSTGPYTRPRSPWMPCIGM